MALRRGLRDWLLANDSDPSVRLRVLRDLLDRPEDDPALVRAQKEIGRKGWAARILREQHPEGQWATSGTSALELYRPKYVATNWRLLVLAAFAALLPAARSPEVLRAIERGAEFYLKRRLSREGPTPYPPWFRLHYPIHYYYDILVGLDVLTSLGYGDDPRMQPAFDRLETMRNPDGTWNLDAHHPDTEDPAYQSRGPFYPLGLEVPGRRSRWITTTALAVLKRAGR